MRRRENVRKAGPGHVEGEKRETERERETECVCVTCKRKEAMGGGRDEIRWDAILHLRSTLMTPARHCEGDHTKQSDVGVA